MRNCVVVRADKDNVRPVILRTATGHWNDVMYVHETNLTTRPRLDAKRGPPSTYLTGRLTIHLEQPFKLYV